MRTRWIKDGRRDPVLSCNAGREGGSLLVGCAIGLGGLLLLVVVGFLLFMRWLLAPATIPDPQSAMFPKSQSFVVARFDPENKAVLDLVSRVATNAPARAEQAKQKPPWLVRWLIGDDPAVLVQRFLPIQIVFSDAPGKGRTAFVFSPGRGRGIAELLSRSLSAKAGEEGEDVVPYQNTVILHGKIDEKASDWWFTMKETNICASTSSDGVKEILDSLGQPLSSSASNTVGMYPALCEGAIVCGASGDLVRMQQVAGWFLAGQEKEAASFQLRGVKLGTCRLSLTGQMTLHVLTELTCTSPEVAQEMQKRLQTAIMPKELAKQIAALRVLAQGDRIYVDFDVLEVDKLIIKFMEERKESAEKG